MNTTIKHPTKSHNLNFKPQPKTNKTETVIDIYNSTEKDVFDLVKYIDSISYKSLVIFASSDKLKFREKFRKNETVGFSLVSPQYFEIRNPKYSLIKALRSVLCDFKENDDKSIFIIQAESEIIKNKLLLAIRNISI